MFKRPVQDYGLLVELGRGLKPLIFAVPLCLLLVAGKLRVLLGEMVNTRCSYGNKTLKEIKISYSI